MTSFDYYMLVFNLALMIGVGLYFSRENTSVSEMFAAGGRSPWWVAGLSGYMTFFSAGAFVVWGGLAYKHGLVAVSINVMHGIAALATGYFVAGRWKEIGVKTPAEYVNQRFGQRVVTFYFWTMMSIRIVSSGIALYSLAVLVSALFPVSSNNIFQDATTGYIDSNWIIIAFGVIVVLYTMIGGLWAVLMTDVLQFIVILISVVFAAILMLTEVGGTATLLSSAPPGFLGISSVEFSIFFLAGWAGLHFFQFGAEWAFAQRYISVPSPRDARRAMYLFGALYVFSPLLFFAPPLLYRVVNPEANPEEAYILAASLVLPIGMLGMVVAAMFSATASMISSQLNVYAGVLATSVIAPIFKMPESDRAVMHLGRLATVLLGAFVASFALAVPHLGGAESIVFFLMSFIGPLFAPAVWGLFNKKIGSRELWVTLAVSFVVAVLLKMVLPGIAFMLDSATLFRIVDWAEMNPRTVDIVYSAVSPAMVLTCWSIYLSKRDLADPGWVKIETNRRALMTSDSTESIESRLPAKCVSISLVLTAVSLLFLVPPNPKHRTLMLLTILSLLGVSAILARQGRKQTHVGR